MRTSTGDVYYKIFGTVKRSTEKAYLWRITRTGQEIWIPKSQTRELSLIPDEDGDISILVKEWILNDKSVSDNDRFSPNDPKTVAVDRYGFDNPADLDDDIPF